MCGPVIFEVDPKQLPVPEEKDETDVAIVRRRGRSKITIIMVEQPFSNTQDQRNQAIKRQ
jgi:hypothetical protein